MTVQNVKRWQWMGISLILGAALGIIQRIPRDNWTARYGPGLTQHQFENALTEQHDDRPCFTNLVVYPEQVQDADGPRRQIYIVAGRYFGRLAGATRDRAQPQWHSRCFIAQTPYHPYGDGEPAGKPPATVLAFLENLKSAGVSYRYAWWRDPRWVMSFWLGGSFLAIGLIWPTVINLLVFGRFFRPREAKPDLRHVHSAPSPEPPKPAVTEADLAAVQKMDQDLEAGLAAELADSAPAAQPAQPPPPVRQLAATKLELTAEEQARQEREFGKDEDDFYPTERHSQPHHVE
ncbi:MAG: hypothetical protein ACHRHE_13060 [Tepidisphaerales bacterium]